GGIPKILLGARKRRAQQTLGRVDAATQKNLDTAVKKAFEQFELLKVDAVMYAKLPQPEIPKQKLIIEAEDFNFKYEGSVWLFNEKLNFSFRGPTKIAIEGENGSGKSTLVNLLKGEPLMGVQTGVLKLGRIDVAFVDQNYSN